MSSINPANPAGPGAARDLSQIIRDAASTPADPNRSAPTPAGVGGDVRSASGLAALRAAIEQAGADRQAASDAGGALGRIESLLADLKSLTARGAESGTPNAQAKIDELIATIDKVASAASFQEVDGTIGPVSYRVDDIAPQIDSLQIERARLAAGTEAQIELEVTEPAAPGELVLSFGSDNLNLGGVDEQFVLEIKGADGARTLSFASGTSLNSLAEAISSFTDVTGVEAIVSHGAIRLNSDEENEDQFVSVRVIDDGNLESAENAGLYTRDPGDDAPTFAGDFDSAAAEQGVTDTGHNAALAGRLSLDGAEPIDLAVVSQGGGAYRLATTGGEPYLIANVTLTAEAATTPGAFNAFTIRGPQPAAGDADSEGASDLITALRNAVQNRQAESQESLDAALAELGASAGAAPASVDSPQDAQQIAASLRAQVLQNPESALAALLGSSLDASRNG